MQSSAWKLVALAGVVAIGFFAVLQTQRGLETDSPGLNEPAGSKSATSGTGKSASPFANNGDGNYLLTQYEPNDAAAKKLLVGDGPDSPFPAGKSDKKTAGKEKTAGPFGAWHDGTAKKETKGRSDGTPPQKRTENNGGFKAPPKAPKDGFPDLPASSDEQKNAMKKSSTAGPDFFSNASSIAEESKTKQPTAGPEKKKPFGGFDFAEEKHDPFTARKSGTNKKTAKSPAKTAGAEFAKQQTQPFGGNSEQVNAKTESRAASKQKTKNDNPFLTEKMKTELNKEDRKAFPRSGETGTSSTGKTTGKKSQFGQFTRQPAGKNAISGTDGNQQESTQDSLPPAKKSQATVKEKKRKPILMPTVVGQPENGQPELKVIEAPPKLMPNSKAAPIRTVGQSTGHATNGVGLGSYQVLPQQTQRPQLTIEKKAPNNAVLGKPFVYDIVIKNNGTSAARRVVVTDPVPNGVQLVGTDPQAVLTKRKLVWNLEQIEPGKSKTISVKVTPLRAGQIGSIATVNFVSEVASRTTIKAPKLVFEFHGPKNGKVGQLLPFTFKVTNAGTSAARDVWIRDILPDGLKHASGDDLEYKVGQLAPGKSEQVTLNLKVTRDGTLTNRGIVTAAGGIRIESKIVTAVSAPKLVITRSGPEKRYVGLKALYRNLVTNTSGETVNGAYVTETIPQGMEFVQASDGGVYDPAKRAVTWNVGKLGPRQSRTLSLMLLPKKVGVNRSVVQAGATGGGGVVQTASATRVVGYSAVGVDVPAIEQPVKIGDQFALRIYGKNRGTVDAGNVKMTITLPAQLSLVGVRGRGKYATDGNTVLLHPTGSIEPNKRAAFDLLLKAVGDGDARVKVAIQSDGMSKPLAREEAILVQPN